MSLIKMPALALFLILCSISVFQTPLFAGEETKKGTATFVYGNREPILDGLKKAWGFSALIRYDGKNILFNAAGIESILENNFKVLNISPEKIDAIVISHHHWEMINGLGFILKKNPLVPIYTTKESIEIMSKTNPEWTPNFRLVKDHEQFTPNIIFQNMKSGRGLGGPRGINEVHIIIKTDKGLVIFTGCGHPQLLLIVHKSEQATDINKVNLIAGGTRLLRPGNHISIKDSGENFSIKQPIYYSDEDYATLMDDLKNEGVENVMPTHCTLEPAESIFKKSFGGKYINESLGMTLEFPIDE